MLVHWYYITVSIFLSHPPHFYFLLRHSSIILHSNIDAPTSYFRMLMQRELGLITRHRDAARTHSVRKDRCGASSGPWISCWSADLLFSHPCALFLHQIAPPPPPRSTFSSFSWYWLSSQSSCLQESCKQSPHHSERWQMITRYSKLRFGSLPLLHDLWCYKTSILPFSIHALGSRVCRINGGDTPNWSTFYRRTYIDKKK